MRAALVEPGGTFHVEDLADPAPGPGELVLRVTGCGICGSDLKACAFMPSGTVMGHEFAGEVVALGADVDRSWRVGEHVAALPLFSCGRCDRCRSGLVAHCTDARYLGLAGAPGAFAELVRVSATLAFHLPESLPPALGALVEPYAVGLHTARAGGIGPGDRVLILGGGAVGLTTAAWARLLGAEEVTVSDPAEARRAAARRLGATVVVDPAGEELGGPYDVVVECVGKPGLLDQAAAVAEASGRIVVAGVCAEPDPFLPVMALMKELTIRFSVFYTPEEFGTVVEAFATGRIDPAPLMSRTAGLAELDEVFTSLAASTHDLKVVVDPSR